MSDFNEPAYPTLIDSMLCHDGAYTHSAHPGLTIRQQAVLMMADAMIKAGAPIFSSEEEIRAYGDAACDWADIVLRAEKESRE